MFGAWSVCTHVHISCLYHHFLYLSFLVFLFFFSLSSRPKINKYLISKLAQRSIAFCRSSLYFSFFSFPFHLFFSPLLPFLPAYSPIVPFPIALQRSGDDVSIHAFTLISPPYLVLLAFHPYVEDVPILVVSQPNGSYEILRHRFPPGNRVFSIQGNLIQRSFECRALFPFVHSLLLSLSLPFLESMKSWRAS